MTTPQQLNQFYGSEWNGRDETLDQYEFSGYALGEQIRLGEKVIHINCGNNPFKGMIPNLTGIDANSSDADYQLTVAQFKSAHIAQKFNVAFCLDALNYGPQSLIENQINDIICLLRKRDSRIYWRTPTVAVNSEYYDWTFDEHIRLATMFNYNVIGICWDANNRIYAEWNSNNSNIQAQ